MINLKREHLVPPIIQDRVAALLNEANTGHNAKQEKEAHATMLEAVNDYITSALLQYAKKSPFKHKKSA